jgi:DNA-binding transcriptional LysR family regulator
MLFWHHSTRLAIMRHLRILEYVDEVARTGSIRKAADRLHVTASAMNRRIQDLEAELGAAIFMRRPRGVRLTAAGELFVRYLREQLANQERLGSQIEDLRGLRRGTVRIACSQAVAHDFLPRRIAAFRARHPMVAFEARVMDHEAALTALADYEVELILVFRPSLRPNLRPLMMLDQRLAALMRADNPLAARQTVRLSDCSAYPVALPAPSMGGRQLLDDAQGRMGLSFNVVAESNSFELLRAVVLRHGALSFQIEIGGPAVDDTAGLVARPVDPRDVPWAPLVLAQLRGRSLPVATAMFAEDLRLALASLRQPDAGPV